MSKKYNCASCLGFSIDKITMSNKNMKPLWLSEKDYVSDFISKQNKTSVKNPEKYDTKMEINLGERFKNKKLLYWAAESSSSVTIKDAKEAWQEYANARTMLSYSENEATIARELLTISQKEREAGQSDAAAVLAAEETLESALKDLSDDSMSLVTTVYDLLDVVNMLEPSMIEDTRKAGSFNTSTQ